MILARYLLILTVSVITCTPSSAAVVLGWEFDGTVGALSTADATTNNLSASPVTLSRGSGLVASSYANSFSSSSFTNSGAIADAVTNGDFLQFNFFVPTNTVLSLSAIDANVYMAI